MRRFWFLCAFLGGGLVLVGCDHIPGRPGPGPEVVRPDQVLSFSVLYKTNCAACHGASGQTGPAISLSNPVYLAVAGEDTLRTITAKGVPGSLMPAFAKSAGGTLTDQQVEVLVHGMLQQRGRTEMLSMPGLPSYSAQSTGDAARGFEAFGAHCTRCHGADGEGSAGDGKSGAGRIGSIVNGSYLALISDRGLRSIVIAGRPEEGMPDWRSDGAQPLTEQQITDIVAWLASKRVANPGQPYAAKP